MTFRLRDADPTMRIFITVFLCVLSVGYMIGLFFVDHTTAGTPTGIEEQFLGSQYAAEMKYEKSVGEMFVFLHNHLFSLSLVFFCLGSIFYFSTIVSSGWKTFLLVEPFVALLTTFGGIALVRFVAPWMSWLVFASGVSLFVCYVAMAVLILTELWLVKT
ncbi:MAG TPA: hypothetical protein VGB89_03035 [Bacteroidota bacterium]|jgi:hypothetical protein